MYTLSKYSPGPKNCCLKKNKIILRSKKNLLNFKYYNKQPRWRYLFSIFTLFLALDFDSFDWIIWFCSWSCPSFNWSGLSFFFLLFFLSILMFRMYINVLKLQRINYGVLFQLNLCSKKKVWLFDSLSIVHNNSNTPCPEVFKETLRLICKEADWFFWCRFIFQSDRATECLDGSHLQVSFS